MKIDAQTATAIWGATTGTGALLIQAVQWWADHRPVLKTDCEMMIEHRDKTRKILRIHAVNLGRRPMKIKRVAILLSTATAPEFAHLPAEQQASLLKGLVASELCIFAAEGAPALDLPPDGGEKTWRVPITDAVEFLAEPRKQGNFGKGYIMLTSGTKQYFDFGIMSRSASSLAA